MTTAPHDYLAHAGAGFVDDRTGRLVRNISPWADAHCVCPYFYLQPMSADERYLVFASDRDGRWELYRLALSDERVVKLFDRTGALGIDYDDLWNTFEPGDGSLLTYDDGAYMAVDIETLERRTIVEPDDSAAMRLHTPATRLDDGRLASFFRDPATGGYGIAVADPERGTCREVMRWPKASQQLTHLLAVPGRPAVTFVGGPDRQNSRNTRDPHRARCWMLSIDTGEFRPFLTMPVGHRATHEYWEPTRGRLFFHRKDARTWTPTQIASIDRDGRRYREHYASADRKLGHSFVSPDGRLLVCDVQEPNDNELILVDLETGESRVLCWPNSTMAPQPVGHVHPLFTPSGRSVLFTSDVTGKAGIYTVAVDRDRTDANRVEAQGVRSSGK